MKELKGKIETERERENSGLGAASTAYVKQAGDRRRPEHREIVVGDSAVRSPLT